MALILDDGRCWAEQLQQAIESEREYYEKQKKKKKTARGFRSEEAAAVTTRTKMDPTPPVVMRPILKTATKTSNRTRFLTDSKYKSYSQNFHFTNYSSTSSRSSRASTASSTTSSSISTSSGSSSTGTSSGSSFSGMSIMNSLSSSAEPMASSASTTASSRERKRSDEIFLTPGDRRVTFSPFTKIPRKPKSKKALAGTLILGWILRVSIGLDG